jgi:hypothetical protein
MSNDADERRTNYQGGIEALVLLDGVRNDGREWPERFGLSDSGPLGRRYLKACIIQWKGSVESQVSRNLRARQREEKHTQTGRFPNV